MKQSEECVWCLHPILQSRILNQPVSRNPGLWKKYGHFLGTGCVECVHEYRSIRESLVRRAEPHDADILRKCQGLDCLRFAASFDKLTTGLNFSQDSSSFRTAFEHSKDLIDEVLCCLNYALYGSIEKDFFRFIEMTHERLCYEDFIQLGFSQSGNIPYRSMYEMLAHNDEIIKEWSIAVVSRAGRLGKSNFKSVVEPILSNWIRELDPIVYNSKPISSASANKVMRNLFSGILHLLNCLQPETIFDAVQAFDMFLDLIFNALKNVSNANSFFSSELALIIGGCLSSILDAGRTRSGSHLWESITTLISPIELFCLLKSLAVQDVTIMHDIVIMAIKLIPKLVRSVEISIECDDEIFTTHESLVTLLNEALDFLSSQLNSLTDVTSATLIRTECQKSLCQLIKHCYSKNPAVSSFVILVPHWPVKSAKNWGICLAKCVRNRGDEVMVQVASGAISAIMQALFNCVRTAESNSATSDEIYANLLEMLDPLLSKLCIGTNVLKLPICTHLAIFKAFALLFLVHPTISMQQLLDRLMGYFFHYIQSHIQAVQNRGPRVSCLKIASISAWLPFFLFIQDKCNISKSMVAFLFHTVGNNNTCEFKFINSDNLSLQLLKLDPPCLDMMATQGLEILVNVVNDNGMHPDVKLNLFCSTVLSLIQYRRPSPMIYASLWGILERDIISSTKYSQIAFSENCKSDLKMELVAAWNLASHLWDKVEDWGNVCGIESRESHDYLVPFLTMWVIPSENIPALSNDVLRLSAARLTAAVLKCYERKEFCLHNTGRCLLEQCNSLREASIKSFVTNDKMSSFAIPTDNSFLMGKKREYSFMQKSVVSPNTDSTLRKKFSAMPLIIGEGNMKLALSRSQGSTLEKDDKLSLSLLCKEDFAANIYSESELFSSSGRADLITKLPTHIPKKKLKESRTIASYKIISHKNRLAKSHTEEISSCKLKNIVKKKTFHSTQEYNDFTAEEPKLPLKLSVLPKCKILSKSKKRARLSASIVASTNFNLESKERLLKQQRISVCETTNAAMRTKALNQFHRIVLSMFGYLQIYQHIEGNQVPIVPLRFQNINHYVGTFQGLLAEEVLCSFSEALSREASHTQFKVLSFKKDNESGFSLVEFCSVGDKKQSYKGFQESDKKRNDKESSALHGFNRNDVVLLSCETEEFTDPIKCLAIVTQTSPKRKKYKDKKDIITVMVYLIESGKSTSEKEKNQLMESNFSRVIKKKEKRQNSNSGRSTLMRTSSQKEKSIGSDIILAELLGREGQIWTARYLDTIITSGREWIALSCFDKIPLMHQLLQASSHPNLVPTKNKEKGFSLVPPYNIESTHISQLIERFNYLISTCNDSRDGSNYFFIHLLSLTCKTFCSMKFKSNFLMEEKAQECLKSLRNTEFRGKVKTMVDSLVKEWEGKLELNLLTEHQKSDDFLMKQETKSSDCSECNIDAHDLISSSLWDSLTKEYNASQLRILREVGASAKNIENINKNNDIFKPNIGGVNPIMLVQGPPGTGKTRTIQGLVSVILNRPVDIYETNETEVAALKYKRRVLLCAPSNGALDELINRLVVKGLKGNDGLTMFPKIVRLGEPPVDAPKSVENVTLLSTISSSMKGTPESVQLDSCLSKIESLRKALDAFNVECDTHKLAETKCICLEHISKIKDDLRDKFIERRKLYRELDSKRVEIRNRAIDSAQIVCATLAGAGHHDLVEAVNQYSIAFEYVIVDEASQATESMVLIPLLLGCKRLILVGDPSQLPPTVKSQRARKCRFDVSLFQRLEEAGHLVHMLNVQYRMDRVIRSFPSQRFYSNRLIDADVIKSRGGKPYSSDKQFSPLVVYNLGKQSRERFIGVSYDNFGEAMFAFEMVNFLSSTKSYRDSVRGNIALISPYQGQVNLLKHLFAQNWKSADSKWEEMVEIATVDSFQGREVDIVILSCVRARNGRSLGFLADERRMNVALTRARYSVIVLCDTKTLGKDKNWASFVEFASSEGLLKETDGRSFSCVYKRYCT